MGKKIVEKASTTTISQNTPGKISRSSNKVAARKHNRATNDGSFGSRRTISTVMGSECQTVSP